MEVSDGFLCDVYDFPLDFFLKTAALFAALQSDAPWRDYFFGGNASKRHDFVKLGALKFIAFVKKTHSLNQSRDFFWEDLDFFQTQDGELEDSSHWPPWFMP